MKKIYFCILLIFIGVQLSAKPADEVKRIFVQPDGSLITLTLRGDEHMSFWQTEDGIIVSQTDGAFRYAYSYKGELIQTTLLAHERSERSEEENRQLAEIRRIADKAVMLRPQFHQYISTRAVGTPTPNLHGERRGIVILMQFPDKSFSMNDPKRFFERMCNEVGFQDYGAPGSVRDYFVAQSDGQFTPTFDVAGPYIADKPLNYYGQDNGSRHDIYVQDLIREAVKKAKADNIDFSLYDWDNDKYVDQVYVIYAGYGQSSGAANYTIWPHESTLASPVLANGKYVKTYACGSELAGYEGNVPDGISTMCHEFSHCLGLPDFYDVNYNSGTGNNYGMNQWSLMASGTSNSNGIHPPAFTGYERAFCGWRTYRDLTEPCRVVGLKPIENGGETYRIVNPGNPDEYFLLENRNGTTIWDGGLARQKNGLPAQGLLIYHVTYSLSRWKANTVNSGSDYQSMVIVPADNSFATTQTINGKDTKTPYLITEDLYPYRGESYTNNSFTPESSPSSVLHLANTDGTTILNAPITDITVGTDGSVSFTFMGGTQTYDEVIAGISTVTDRRQAGQYIGLDGRNYGTDMSTLSPGIYIFNGKKIVIR